MDCSTSSSPVFHYLSKFVQTHVHWVNDALQPSYILPPLSHPVLNLSQHQGLFQWVGSSHQVTKVFGASTSASILPMNIQGWFSLGWTGWISLLSKGLSSIFSSITFQKHQFFSTQPSLWSNSHIHTWLLEEPELWLLNVHILFSHPLSTRHFAHFKLSVSYTWLIKHLFAKKKKKTT